MKLGNLWLISVVFFLIFSQIRSLNCENTLFVASIFVRVAEDRMDLLRAAIIGPKGTPYHDGLFFFDAHFTANYPSQPPVYA
jgi:ubiquitin-protein ligase